MLFHKWVEIPVFLTLSPVPPKTNQRKHQILAGLRHERGQQKDTHESKESHVPTSVWNDQLTGQSQWDDGVLVDQGWERACREGHRTSVAALLRAARPCPSHNLLLAYYLSFITPTKLEMYLLFVSKIHRIRFQGRILAVTRSPNNFPW